MNFFEHQDRARRNTKWLVIYFAAAVALMIVAIYAVFAGIFLHDAGSLWNTELFAGVALATILIIMGGSLVKTIALRQGGGAVATMLGGRPVDPNTTDPDERKLLNVVEEMAIASGVPVPSVYLLPEEPGINAFAAGTAAGDAAIGVTRGCMMLLNRDELQGVIAHEFSHILNGDMRLNLRLIGLVFGILCLSQLGRILLRTGSGRRSSGDDKKGGNPLPLIGLALMIIGAIGVFFGRLINSAVSRQREFLADAAAVQFTRNPGGLAGALKKIGGLGAGSRINNPHAEEASHLFFGNALSQSWFSLMSTHPPLFERIQRLDPAFAGEFPTVTPPPQLVTESVAPALQHLSTPLLHRSSPPPLPSSAAPAESIVPSIGMVTPQQIEYATDFRQRLPNSLSEAAHEPLGAVTLTYALLVSTDETVRQIQLQRLEAAVGPGIGAETRRLLPETAQLQPNYRLPLLQMAMPALARMSPAQFAQFDKNIGMLIECDEQVDLFEYALQKFVSRRLAARFVPRPPPIVQFYSLRPLLPDCAVLLSIVAHSGHSDEAQARKAFASGAQRFGTGQSIEMMELSRCGLDAVDAALTRLAQAAPAIKKAVVEACARAAATDGFLQVYEAELLRAIADALDCPIPPFIHGI